MKLIREGEQVLQLQTNPSGGRCIHCHYDEANGLVCVVPRGELVKDCMGGTNKIATLIWKVIL